MDMAQVAKRWTREEVLALPDDGNRYELVDGELLVSPSPRALHQVAVTVWCDRVKPYVTATSGPGFRCTGSSISMPVWWKCGRRTIRRH